MNNASAPKLDTPDRALAYLRFYVGSKNDPDRGRWRLIDHAEDVDWFASASGGLRANLAGKIRPLILESSSDKEWQAIGTVQFGDNFWEASFHLSRDGVVKIPPYDKQIGAELPVFLDAFSNEIRAQQTMELLNHAKPQRDLAKAQKTLAANPKDEEALRQVPGLYYGMKRWKEAVEAEKTRIAFIHRQTKHDSDWSKTLAGAYVSLSWYQLFARDFAGALTSSEEAINLDRANLAAETNHAHALLFLDRAQEAEAIYLQHRGEKVFSGSDEKWEQAILTDFDDLEKAGITHPEFARLRVILKPPSK
jgi:tetratricopeptide (TPR) repeat protein